MAFGGDKFKPISKRISSNKTRIKTEYKPLLKQYKANSKRISSNKTRIKTRRRKRVRAI